MPKNKTINLLPQEEFESSIIGRILRWAMGTFRIIVVITEVIVMGAFLSRFWLDAQNSNLTDAIKIKSSQIQSLADIEKKFRSVQSKLSIFKQIRAEVSPSKKLDLITSKLPAGVTLTGVSLTGDTAQIRGSSGSENAISQYYANLKAEKTFKSVDLGQVSSSETNSALIVFSITIKY